MTRKELVATTHKLGYDFVWRSNLGGMWYMGRQHPKLYDEGSHFQYWFLYGSVGIYANVEFEGTDHESLVCYKEDI